jgi:hypothetical protein
MEEENDDYTFHWMPSLGSGFSPLLARVSAIRKMATINSVQMRLQITATRKIRGAPMRSAKIPNPVEALNPKMINKTAINPAENIDSP